MFMHGGGFGGLFLGLIVLLILVSLGLRIFLFSRRRRNWSGGHARRGPKPEQILARRFARGEIDEDEYHRRLSALQRRAGPGP